MRIRRPQSQQDGELHPDQGGDADPQQLCCEAARRLQGSPFGRLAGVEEDQPYLVGAQESCQCLRVNRICSASLVFEEKHGAVIRQPQPMPDEMEHVRRPLSKGVLKSAQGGVRELGYLHLSPPHEPGERFLDSIHLDLTRELSHSTGKGIDDKNAQRWIGPQWLGGLEQGETSHQGVLQGKERTPAGVVEQFLRDASQLGMVGDQSKPEEPPIGSCLVVDLADPPGEERLEELHPKSLTNPASNRPSSTHCRALANSSELYGDTKSPEAPVVRVNLDIDTVSAAVVGLHLDLEAAGAPQSPATHSSHEFR